MLPEFPTDDETLDLLEAAITCPIDGKSGVFGTLDLLAGINPAEDDEHLTQIGPNMFSDDRPHYHANDCILALIRALRSVRSSSTESDKPD